MNSTDLFLKMVRIDSEPGNEEEFGQFCSRLFKAVGFVVSKDTYGNIIAQNRSRSKQSSLLLSAHLDTVKPGNSIQPVVKNGVIKSSGKTILGADNKLAIAVYFEAINSLQKEGKIIRPLEVVLTCKEELGMLGAKSLDFSQIRSKEGISLDTEGPINHFVSSSPYAEIFDISIEGKAAHAAYPEKGTDALKIFSKAYAKLKTGRLNQYSTLNFGLISGGTANNVVMSNVEVSGNLRSHQRTEIARMKEEIKNVFETVAESNAGKSRIKFSRVIDGYKHNDNDNQIIKLKESVSSHLFSQVTNSASDANIFHEHGIKVIELCHGAMNTHATNEQVSEKNLKVLVSLVKEILVNY
jgi:tripeptide aminopeptidase